MAENILSGKIAVVTGASKGIGKAVALELARNGAKIIVNYNRSEDEATKVVKSIKDLGGEGIAIKADVSKLDEVRKMFDTLGKSYKKIDILVNNAGIIRDRTLKNMTAEEWNDVINTNLTGVFNVTKLALPLMVPGGRIINISSIIGMYGNFGQCNYAAAKAGVIGFTKSLAKELGKKKITVNAVAPGFVKTDITREIPFFRKKIINYMTSLKEEADPEDVAHVVAFLASSKSRFVTGSVINVDGGLAF